MGPTGSDPAPAWCAVTPLAIERVANNSMDSGGPTTNCTPLNLPPTLGLSGILLFPGQNSLKSSMLSFSPLFYHYFCTYEIHFTRVFCMCHRLGAESDSSLHTQQFT